MKTSHSLHIVRKEFPQVKKVVDATTGVRVSVQKKDSLEGRKKQPNGCALAKACVREMKADGAIINIAYSYIIKGDTATRYKTSVGVGLEITSFDRHQDFAPGNDYLLSAISPSARMHTEKRRGRSGSHNPHKKHLALHKTENIRVSNK